MPAGRDSRFDASVRRVLEQAIDADGEWITFKLYDRANYTDRLGYQRAIYYLGNHENKLGRSFAVQWQTPDGRWEKLSTPRGAAAGRLGTSGETNRGRISAHSKTAGRKHVKKTGASYNPYHRAPGVTL